MLFQILQLIVGIIVLVKSSEFVVNRAINLATKSGVSKFTIGLLLVGFSTSLPELSITLVSAFEKQAILGTSVLFGSNITDVTLNLGFAAFLSIIYISKKDAEEMKKAILISSFIASIAIFLGSTNFIFGLFCLSVFYLYLEFFLKTNDKKRKTNMSNRRFLIESIIIFLSIIILIFSADMITKAAVSLSGVLEITFLGGVIIAVGSALPELAVSINSIRKNDTTLLLSNITGSLIVNLTLILGLGSIISATIFTTDVVKIALFMIIANAILWVSIKDRRMTFKESFILLLMYALFVYGMFA